MPAIENIGEYGRMLASEALVGLLLGFGMNILFSGIQVAGQIVSQLSGLSLAEVFSPGFEEDVSIFSQLFYFVTLAVFVAIGGHRIMTEALLDTFTAAPPGHAGLGSNFVDVLVNILTQSFALGIRAAAPLMVALLVVEHCAWIDQPDAAADQCDCGWLQCEFAAGVGTVVFVGWGGGVDVSGSDARCAGSLTRSAGCKSLERSATQANSFHGRVGG